MSERPESGAQTPQPEGPVGRCTARSEWFSHFANAATHVWTRVYRVVAHAVGLVLTRGAPGAAVYTRASLAGAISSAGSPTVDLVIVLATDAQADRARARWQRLHPALSAGGLVDLPLIYGPAELGAVAGRWALTDDGVAFGGPRVTRDAVRTLQRPELDGGKIATWQRLRGPDRRPPPRPSGVQEQRIAAGSSSSTGGASRSRPPRIPAPPCAAGFGCGSVA